MNIQSSTLPRLAPFLIFMLMLALNQHVSDMLSHFNFHENYSYVLRILSAFGLLLYFKSAYIELFVWPPIKQILLAAVAGYLVLLVWLIPYPDWLGGGDRTSFIPYTEDTLSWIWIGVRLTGAILIVPLMEELFWRSFLMRRLISEDFLNLDPSLIKNNALIISAILFSLAHHLWLAAFIAGLIYGILYRIYQNLWVPVVAHVTTNCFLGIWVVMTHNWSYW